MKQLLQSFWWWVRVGLLLVVAFYALALIAFNARQRADVWYWPGRPEENTSIIALVLASFIAGGLTCTIGWALFSAWVNYRRTRELRRKRLEQERRDELARKAAMLRVKPPVQPTVRSPKPATPPPPPTVEEEPKAIEMPLNEPAKPPIVTPPPTPAPPPPQTNLPVKASVEESTLPAPIPVEAQRATPFASHPIAPAAAGSPATPRVESSDGDRPDDVIDPPPPAADR